LESYQVSLSLNNIYLVCDFSYLICKYQCCIDKFIIYSEDLSREAWVFSNSTCFSAYSL